MKKFKLASSFIGLLVLFTMTGCSTFKTHSDYDLQTNFDAFKTYTWSDERSIGQLRDGDHPYVSPLDLQRIERAVDSELGTKGFRHVDDREDADFLVSFSIGARDKIEANAYPVSYRDRWRDHWPYDLTYGAAVSVHTYTEGVLAIDFFDRSSGRPVWHGVARKRITGMDTKSRGTLIRGAVEAILSDFPPP